MIVDLAIMMMTAAVVTILFRKLKLPVILGYILAGFLISPYFPLFFDVQNQESIDIWSEIGVIFILFHIGLEFDIHKLARIGSTAIVTAVIKMSGVLVVGYLFGRLIGLDTLNSIFLGAMLSISSTVVIKKTFEELGQQHEKYAALVMGELIMEDILGIFLLVVLSTISVSQNSSGTQLIGQLALMACYLIIWLLLGIFLLPTFLNKVIDVMNDEMLTVLALGICFLMALIASWIGFSMDLGAFLAGSLLAGTVHAEDIERVTAGIKDMFGAVFFLSVGMMVDPSVIAERWTSIVPIAVIAVAAKLLFASIGMTVSGQTPQIAVKGGFSLAPIGEFSFIIANLGITLGVMDEYLYPVIVAAAILTMVFTPSLIQRSDSCIGWMQRHLPARLIRIVQNYTSDDSNEDDEERESDWSAVIKSFFSKLIIYGSIMLVAVLVGIRFLEPLLARMMSGLAAKILASVCIYAVIVIFLRPMLNFHSIEFTHLWMKRRANRPALATLVMVKMSLVAFFAYIPIYAFFGASRVILPLAVMAVIYYVGSSDFIATSYFQIETRFLRNLNEKTIDQEEDLHGIKQWLDEDYSIMTFYVPKDAPYNGRTIEELAWGRNLNIYIVKRRRGQKSSILPPGNATLQSGDKVFVLGESADLETFRRTLGIESRDSLRTLKEFMASDFPDTENALACLVIHVTGQEPYCGKPIREGGILKRGRCMVLGIQREGLTITMPDPNMLIQEEDILWVIGSNNNVGKLAALSVHPE